MHDGFKPRKGRGIREDDSPQGFAVDAAVVAAHQPPESRDDLCRLLPKRVVPECIHVDHGEATARKRAGDNVLTRAVSSRQSDDHAQSPFFSA